MAIPLSPSIQADFLSMRRAGWTVVARPIVAPALLVLGCWLLACVSLYRGFEWCTALSAALALAGSYAQVRGRLTATLVRARFGWCGALPVRAWTTNGALVALTVVALIVAVTAVSLLLVIAAMPAPYPKDLDFALPAVDGGLAIGTAAAILQVLRTGAAARAHHADGIREPLFALPWLNDARLPHLLDWQRRAALVKWRRGGGALVVVVLVAVPDGAAIPMVVGLILLMLSLVWLDVVMRACTAATMDARRLLAATPVTASRFRWASLRYPLVAAICAVVLAAIGTALMRKGFVAIAGWLACAAVASVWPLVCIVKTTNSGRSA